MREWSQWFGLSSHPSIYPMTQRHSKMLEDFLWGYCVDDLPRNSHLLNHTLHNEHLQGKLFGQKGVQRYTQSSQCHQDKWSGCGEAKTEEWSVFCLFLFCLLFFCWLVLNWNGYLYLYFLFYYFFLIFNFYLIFCYFFFNFPLGDTTRVRGGCVGTERWVWFHDMKFPRNEF